MADQLPLLCVDVDGVLSLFPPPGGQLPTRDDIHYLTVDGIPHLIALGNCRRLGSLQQHFELVWATGWEEKANEYLPALVGLAEPIPTISFDSERYDHQAHWKLGAIGAHAGDRPLAWIDDALDDACRQWASSRSAPTLLIDTEPTVGLAEAHLQALIGWAAGLGDRAA